MPRYSWDIKDLVFEEDVRKMYDLVDNRKEAVLLSILWIGGPRPAEIKELKKENFLISENQLSITIATKKLGKDGKFKVKDRTLDFPRKLGVESNLYLETIIQWVQSLSPDTFVLDYTTKWQEDTINDLGTRAIGKRLCPYHLRHSVMTWLARNGATVEQIAHFKGGTVASALQYLHAVPYVVKLENLRRGHNMVGVAIGTPQGAPAAPQGAPEAAPPAPASASPPPHPEPAPASPSENPPAEQASPPTTQTKDDPEILPNIVTGAKDPDFVSESTPPSQIKGTDSFVHSGPAPDIPCRWCGRKKSECQGVACCAECDASGGLGHE